MSLNPVWVRQQQKPDLLNAQLRFLALGSHMKAFLLLQGITKTMTHTLNLLELTMQQAGFQTIKLVNSYRTVESLTWFKIRENYIY